MGLKMGHRGTVLLCRPACGLATETNVTGT